MKKISPMSIIVIVLLLAIVIFLLVPKHKTDLPKGEGVELVFFYSSGCPHCASMEKFLDKLIKEQEYLKIYKYEIKEKDNIKLFFEYADKYGLEVGDEISVPVIFIKERVFVGHNADIESDLEQYVTQCVAEFCQIPDNDVKSATQTIAQGTSVDTGDRLKKVTIPAVILAAAVDAINPCAFAVLIILLTTILAGGIRRKALYAGLMFTLSIFISYFLMGLGLFSALRASGLTNMFYVVVAVLAILIGLFNLKDYLWYGKWFTMEVPLSWRPLMKDVIRGVTSVPGAFLVGFIVSLFLLPCTSGPYIVILGLLAEATTKSYALFLLIIYNLIFILPMLIITLSIYFGFTTTEKAEEWRQRKLKHLHLIAGVIVLLLGIGMFVAIWLGYI